MNATFQHLAADEEEPGFSAFLIPETVTAELTGAILQRLEALGFSILMQMEVDARTGFSVAGYLTLSSKRAEPAVLNEPVKGLLVFAADAMPEPAATPLPFDNRRTLAAQRTVRDLLQAGSGSKDSRTAVWMTASSAHAWAVLRAVHPTALNEVRQQVRALRADFATDPPLAVLTAYGNRAKVELVLFEGAEAIRKTYRPSALPMLQREIEVMRELSPILPEVPRLLCSGDNFLIMERRRGRELCRRRQDKPQPLPLRSVRQLADFLRRCIARGYDPIDFRPAGSVLYEDGSLSVFDFEYWRKSSPESADRSFCLSGVPLDDTAEKPIFSPTVFDPYPRAWFPYICLSKHSFLHDAEWVQRLKRPYFLAVAYLQWFGRLARRGSERIRGRNW